MNKNFPELGKDMNPYGERNHRILIELIRKTKPRPILVTFGNIKDNKSFKMPHIGKTKHLQRSNDINLFNRNTGCKKTVIKYLQIVDGN